MLRHLIIQPVITCLTISSMLFVAFTPRITVAAPHTPRHTTTRPSAQTATPSVLGAAHTKPDAATTAGVRAAYSRLPLRFEANQGQTNSQVQFLARGAGYNLFLTSTEAVFALHKEPDTTSSAEPAAAAPPLPQPASTHSTVLRMQLVGANPQSQVAGQDALAVKTNYFVGNDPTKWRSHVTSFGKVRYAGVYHGIDLVYYGNQQQLEYDFVVAPGADPRQIRLRFAGAERIRIEDGELVVETRGGTVRQRRPVAYQEIGGERREVASRYVVHGRTRAQIVVGDYDSTQPLVIDPVLAYSSYLGGSGSESGTDIAVDTAGNAYVVGITTSTDFPITPNGYQQIKQAGEDVFVTKLNTNAAGAASLVYSTYLGGDSREFGNSIAVDSAGNAYVTGFTFSTDFPTTANAYQQFEQPNGQVFVTKLNTTAAGTVSLAYSTYLGGSGNFDFGNGIAADDAGNAYVTGETDSADFPTTPNAYQGDQLVDDAFVAKLDTNAAGAASLVYSTYLGGNGSDSGDGIAIDAAGNAYVTGGTFSTNYPTLNQYQGNQPGGDAFVTKLNTNLVGAESLVYSTYLGGSDSDFALQSVA